MSGNDDASAIVRMLDEGIDRLPQVISVSLRTVNTGDHLRPSFCSFVDDIPNLSIPDSPCLFHTIQYKVHSICESVSESPIMRCMISAS